MLAYLHITSRKRVTLKCTTYTSILILDLYISL